ncbi:pantoate--beta-alanine ligase, partial [Candidatus Pelagibacter sp.]|nr:pantoate--beta-alanine ligase [Candidatus Pelagibacter sp.]
MKILNNIIDLKKAIKRIPDLGFVPTMGGLHRGHISLITTSKKKCKKTLISIYINPKQFNKIKDFNSYPRNLLQDIRLLKKLKVDFVFIPQTSDIYRNKEKKINLDNVDKILCAKFRKGHFEGVLDIMNRFIKI